VRVQGDEIGLYEHDYKVPEGFEREVKSTTSRGLLLTLIAFGLMVVLGVAAIVVAVRSARFESLRWRLGFVSGGLVFAAYLVMIFNSWPQVKAQYATQIPYAVYIGLAIAVQAIVALLFGLLVLVCTAAGDVEARRFRPAMVAGLGSLGGRRFLATTVHGYGFAFLFLGYVTLFYLFGRRYLGVWMPAEGPYSEVFSTSIPFLAPLAISIVAAVSEEATFRLFAVPYLARRLGGGGAALVLGLVLPAAVWAFAHSTYQVYPVWVRGIELTIAGTAFGILVLKAGILAAVIAHYVIDAVFISTPLITSGDPGYATAGILVVALAAAPAVFALAMRGRAPAIGDAAGAAPAS
jgi:membrane protease YdiL (CAAX protease family)